MWTRREVYIYMIKACPNTTILTIVQKEIIHNAKFAGEHFFCLYLFVFHVETVICRSEAAFSCNCT